MSTDPHTVQARAALDGLNQALTNAGLNFHLAGFATVENRTYPTFSVQMTTAQAELITARLAGEAPPVASKGVFLTPAEMDYLARAVDLGRSDPKASSILSPTERDRLLRKLGGRRD